MMRLTGNRAAVPATATVGNVGAGRTSLGVAGIFMVVSGIAAVLPKQMQGFLDRPVGIGEQHGVVAARLVPDAMPGGHNENVALVPLDDEVLAGACGDDATSASLDRHEHGRVS